ncbi:MAG: DUF1963 domain-containing protein [Lachnospiraceae bacterium]|nr:DUF1963 domain-containing protein [Lachnospiraceae bacterium]
MQSGALKQFTAILKDPKKFRKADAWKAFFLSEEFLKEQYSESFADGMFRILADWHTADNFNIVQLPSGFLQELAVAYALVLNGGRGDGEAQDITESFYARRIAASIWNMQQGGLPMRLLLKPENLVRMYSFADYIRLKGLNEKKLLTPGSKETWKKLLRGGYSHHLYELKGRGPHDIISESRSVCLIDLLTFWLRSEAVPKCVLETMYQEYNFRNIEHTSTRKIYAELKQEIVSQYPDIEETLYGEEGKEKLVSSWYRELMQIISDSEALYEDTDEIRERVRVLFTRPEWPKIRYSPELFDRMYLQLCGRSVIPACLAERLISFYSDESGVIEGAWDRVRGIAMLESLLHSLHFSRRISERQHPALASFTAPDMNKISSRDADFWHYYLMRGFGCRKASFTNRRKHNLEYAEGGLYSLPAYMEYIYQPSARWQKLFTGFDKTGGDAREDRLDTDASSRNMAENSPDRNSMQHQTPLPPSMEFTLPDQKRLRVEFHLHYVLYYLDGEPVLFPPYSFRECLELSRFIEGTPQLFFLLAVTEIGEQDYSMAAETIEAWLNRLPLHPVTIPVIARLLASGNGRDWESENTEVACAVYYTEEENLCFRAVVRESRITLYRQTVLGWEPIHTIGQTGAGAADDSAAVSDLDTSGTPLSIESKKRLAQEFLRGMKRPAPVCLASADLSGMTNEEKAERIIEALKQHEIYRRRRNGLPPWLPGYPWRKRETDSSADDVRSADSIPNTRDLLYTGSMPNMGDLLCTDNISNRGEHLHTDSMPITQDLLCIDTMPDTGDALTRFFRRDGGFLTESYCVLQFEPPKTEQVFYCSMRPFDFRLSLRDPDWLSSRRFRMEELGKKMKEKHWIVGHFGWGGTIGPDGHSIPTVFAVGESGSLFFYDVVRMQRSDSLAGLLAKMFDFSKVTAVETWQGCLSISRLDGTLEYCYGRDAFLQSAHTTATTAADLFTTFTKAEMMDEFAVFVDEMLANAPDLLFAAYFELVREAENAYSMRLYRQNRYNRTSIHKHYDGESPAGSKESREPGPVLCYEHCESSMPENCYEHCESLMPENKQLVWKLWPQGESFSAILEDFTDVVRWYMENGKYGRKLENCLKIDVGFPAADGKLPPASTIYKNTEGILDAFRKRTALTAWSITAEKGKNPGTFDSKFGGLPYWDPTMEYPTDSDGQKLVLLAQINLDAGPMEAPMPDHGMLQFFGCAWEIFDKNFGWRTDQDKYRVVYHETIDYGISADELIRLGIPDGRDRRYGRTPASTECAAGIVQKTAYMGPDDYRFNTEFLSAVRERFGADSGCSSWSEILDDMTVEKEIASRGHWLLGYPRFAGCDPRALDAELQPYDRLLFRYDVHYLPDGSWLEDNGLCGFANFFISGEQLERMDFSNVLYHWECCGEE